MPTAFILLATQRTGSSWVQEMLNSHPRVKVYSELFLGEGRGTPMWEPNDIEFANSFWEQNARFPRRLTRPYWTIKFLQRVYDQPGCEAAGFKYMYDQVRHSPAVLVHAAVSRVRVVHLVRRNLLDTVISAELALRRGRFHDNTDGRPAIPWFSTGDVDSQVRLEPSALIRELRRMTNERQRARAWLRLTRTPSFEVEYESLAADRSKFGEILGFLGVSEADAAELNSGLNKIRTEPRATVVENFDEVERALLGTPYEGFLQA
jgi:LPS sulfotransferase NodH